MLDRIALILLVIGGINWGSIGIFQFDFVAWICGGQTGMISRCLLYTDPSPRDAHESRMASSA